MTAPTPTTAQRAAADAFVRAHLDHRWQGWLVEPLAALLATHAAPAAEGLPETPPAGALTAARRRLGEILSAHGSSWGHVDDMIRFALAAFDDGVLAAHAAPRAADAGVGEALAAQIADLLDAESPCRCTDPNAPPCWHEALGRILRAAAPTAAAAPGGSAR